MVLNLNGNSIGVSCDLAAKMRAWGFSFDFFDARAAALALIAAGPGLRIGVPFAFSMHRALIHHWLESLGCPLPEGLEIYTIPSPHMTEALAAGEIDVYQAGAAIGLVFDFQWFMVAFGRRRDCTDRSGSAGAEPRPWQIRLGRVSEWVCRQLGADHGCGPDYRNHRLCSRPGHVCPAITFHFFEQPLTS